MSQVNVSCAFVYLWINLWQIKGISQKVPALYPTHSLTLLFVSYRQDVAIDYRWCKIVKPQYVVSRDRVLK